MIHKGQVLIASVQAQGMDTTHLSTTITCTVLPVQQYPMIILDSAFKGTTLLLSILQEFNIPWNSCIVLSIN